MPDKPSARSDPSPSRGHGRRWLWFGLGAIAIVVLVAALALPALLDVERYRGHIESALQSATGWDAELGTLDLSVLRGLALTVSPAGLRAPDGDSKLEIAAIRIDAELFPLLSGELNVRKIELVRPEIIIVRPSVEDGWLLPAPLDPARAAEPPSASPSPPPAAGDSADAATGQDDGGFSMAIEEIQIDNGRLRVEDRSTTPPMVIDMEKLNLEILPVEGTLSGDGRLADSGGAVALRGSLDKQLTIELEDLKTDLLLPLVGEDILRPGGLLSGEIEVSQMSRIGGVLKARELQLLSGERPFDEANLEFDLLSESSGWQLHRMRLDADGVVVEGEGSLVPDIALRLNLLETPLDTALHAAESVLPLPLDISGPGMVRADIRVDQPLGQALTYDAEGELTAARFRASELLPAVEALRSTFALDRSGALDVQISEAQVGGGPLVGTARIDSIQPLGMLTFDGSLENAVLGTLLTGFVGEQASEIHGPAGLRAAMSIDLTREVIDASALGGRLELSASDVTAPGWDLENELDTKLGEKLASIRQIRSLIDELRGREPQTQEPGASDAGDIRKDLLDRLGLKLDFNALPWTLDAFRLDAGQFGATGVGSFDPISGAVDVELTARLDEQRTAELVGKYDELDVLVDRGRLTVPLHVSGPLLGPAVGVELDQVAATKLSGEDKEDAVKGLLKDWLKKKKKDD
jgi:hypothetical protein